MIKNIIFDFGNVLCEFYPEKLSQPYARDEESLKRISEVVFDRLYWDRLDDGTISDEEVRCAIRSRLPGEEGEIGCKIYDNWVYNLTPVKGMPELVAELKAKGKKLYLLSSISKGFAENYNKVPWIKDVFSLFDGIVLSGTIGIVKPHREIFDYLLHKYNLKAEESVFIDDSKKNIDGAGMVGINAYLFKGNCDELRRTLIDL